MLLIQTVAILEEFNRKPVEVILHYYCCLHNSMCQSVVLMPSVRMCQSIVMRMSKVMDATCQWNTLAWRTQPGACLIRATSVAWRRWGNIKRTKYETAAGYTIRPGWLMLYLRALRWSDESLIGTPRSCAVSCLPFAPLSAHPRTVGPCGKLVNVTIIQPRPTTQVLSIDPRLFEWRVSRAKAAAGANVHIVNGEWRQPRHSGGPLHNPSGGRWGYSVCQESCFIHKPSVRVKFNSKQLGCVVSRRYTKPREADKPLRSTYRPASGPLRAEN